MRAHGWGGSPPADDDQARKRILDAAIVCLDRSGPARTNLSRVAAELGVTRQTVYRYYPSTDDLFAAVALAASNRLVQGTLPLLQQIHDPADLVVELMAYIIERMPSSPHLHMLLVNRPTDRLERGVADPEAIARNVALLRDHTAVDWTGLGYTDRDLGELVELIHRLTQSMVVAPPAPLRRGARLRAYLHRWIGPALAGSAGDG